MKEFYYKTGDEAIFGVRLSSYTKRELDDILDQMNEDDIQFSTKEEFNKLYSETMETEIEGENGETIGIIISEKGEWENYQ